MQASGCLDSTYFTIAHRRQTTASALGGRRFDQTEREYREYGKPYHNKKKFGGLLDIFGQASDRANAGDPDHRIGPRAPAGVFSWRGRVD
jgi:hypothetical protein